MADDLYSPTYKSSRALIIGINDYLHVSPLDYAVNDAEAVKDVLTVNFGFLPECLMDKDATKERILSTFLAFARPDVHPDDRLLFFFAGHGHTVSGNRGEVGYLVPYDADMDNLASLIRWDELTRNADLIRAKHVFFIMDACYGGLAITRALPPGAMRFLDDMLKRYTRQVLTAGKADETVSDAGGPLPKHSVFTGHLIEALNGKAETADGIMTANGVMSYVYERVSKDHGSQQTPHYGFIAGDGDFIFKGFEVGEKEAGPEGDKNVLVAVPATLPNPKDDGSGYIELTKQYLSDPKYRIALDDLVTRKMREYISNYTRNEFTHERQEFTADEVLKRLKFYETLITEIQSISMCVSHWGAENHSSVLRKIFSRISDPLDLKAGSVGWLNLRWYPVMLLTYASGISAIAGERYDNLSEILLADGRSAEASPRQENLMLTLGDAAQVLHEVFKMVPGQERNYVPRSEYLFKLLQPVLDDLLFLGRDYESVFDRFEVIFALVYADMCMRKRDHLWGPPGRFVYKGRIGSSGPFEELTREAERMGNDWPLLKRGLFGGSVDRFKEIKDSYKELLNSGGWR
jgi:hypothetical protein